MIKYLLFFLLLTLMACSSDVTKKSESDETVKNEAEATAENEAIVNVNNESDANVKKNELEVIKKNKSDVTVKKNKAVKYKISILELDYPEILGVVKRADWGWVSIDTAVNFHKIEKITLHHGGVEFKEDKDPVEYLRDLQSWSRSDKKWADIPYHYMIDLDGVIYECRPINIPGDTNTEYDPESHALICVMGNYEVQTFSEKQLQAVIKMCVYLVQRFDIPADEIKGHKDYSKITDCPGKDFYRYLEDGTIVARVNKIVNGE